MSNLTIAVTVATLLGSAIIGGVFFAFSSFVMGALGRVPPESGISAMQSINITVINRSFLGTFLGTAVGSLVAAGLAIATWPAPFTPYLIAGAVSYVVGTFAVTIFGNVPLNTKLGTMDAAHEETRSFWLHYQARWTLLNTVRTAAALIAAVLYTVALLVA